MKANNKDNVHMDVQVGTVGPWIEKHPMMVAMILAGLVALLFWQLTGNVGTGLSNGYFV